MSIIKKVNKLGPCIIFNAYCMYVVCTDIRTIICSHEIMAKLLLCLTLKLHTSLQKGPSD